MSELEQERYCRNLAALTECIVRGVSEEAVRQLAFECGIAKQDLETIYNFKVAA